MLVLIITSGYAIVRTTETVGAYSLKEFGFFTER